MIMQIHIPVIEKILKLTIFFCLGSYLNYISKTNMSGRFFV